MRDEERALLDRRIARRREQVLRALAHGHGVRAGAGDHASSGADASGPGREEETSYR